MQLEGWMAAWGRWGAVLIFLGYGAIRDKRRREISLPVTALTGGMGVVYALMCSDHTLLTFLVSALPGLILLAVGLLSGGRAGLGDALTMLACAGFLLENESIEVLTLASITAAVYSGFLLIKGRRGDTEIPFVPFLLLGAALTLTLEKLV